MASRSPSPEGPKRKISAPAYYATPSYITIEKSKTRKSSFKKFGVQKESQPDKHMYDPSLLFARTNRCLSSVINIMVSRTHPGILVWRGSTEKGKRVSEDIYLTEEANMVGRGKRWFLAEELDGMGSYKRTTR